MAIEIAERIGQRTFDTLAGFGEFSMFSGKALRFMVLKFFSPRMWRLVLPQMFEVGVKSVPVVCVTGAFIGMVLAIETYSNFKSIGQEIRLGGIISLSVIKQIGPVMAAMMLAGRVGGALTAELGTMNVTEQLDALRVMGTDPIRHLVVPRLMAALLLTPILTMYSDLCGVVGGWLISTQYLGVPTAPYWRYAAASVENWQIGEGLFKSIFFGGAIGLISCYKGFTCGSGASGVGRACTEAFVSAFISIIVMNFFFADLLQQWYRALFNYKSVFS